MPHKDPIERKKYRKKYYKENREILHIKTNLWREKNKKRSNEINNKSYYKNREKVIKRNIEYERKKLKTDIKLVLRKRLRCRLHQALKGINKSKSTMELLGVPHIDFFKTYIECKFKPGMTWENRSLWHIDHVLPCSSFDLTKPEEQAKCFHYTNLQPLWASENLSKGNRIS